jgi:hypothetical protein
VAFLLTYYGHETSRAVVEADLGRGPSLADVRAYLDRHYALSTQEWELHRGFPYVATLVRVNGEFVVVDQASEGVLEVFSPVRGSFATAPGTLSAAGLGLFPVSRPQEVSPSRRSRRP